MARVRKRLDGKQEYWLDMPAFTVEEPAVWGVLRTFVKKHENLRALVRVRKATRADRDKIDDQSRWVAKVVDVRRFTRPIPNSPIPETRVARKLGGDLSRDLFGYHIESVLHGPDGRKTKSQLFGVWRPTGYGPRPNVASAECKKELQEELEAYKQRCVAEVERSRRHAEEFRREREELAQFRAWRANVSPDTIAKIKALASPNGRTEEEAKAFRAKAAELALQYVLNLP